MSQVFKSLFGTTSQLKAAERIARAYKTKIISFLDKAHQNPADWQRLETYVSAKEPAMNEMGLVEAMARGNFHPRRAKDPAHFRDRLTLFLLDKLGIPKKAVHVNEDGTEDSIIDIPEKEQAILAAKIAAAREAAARAEAAASSKSSTKT